MVAHHSTMSAAEWWKVYHRAWDAYYTPEHMMKIVRRGVANGTGMSRLQTELFFYLAAHRTERMHPLQAGVVRLTYRLDQRPGLPIEPAWKFSPKFALVIWKHVDLAMRWIALARMVKQARREQAVQPYIDLALAPRPISSCARTACSIPPAAMCPYRADKEERADGIGEKAKE